MLDTLGKLSLFSRSASAIFDKIGRTASEEVTLELQYSCLIFICVLICGFECFSKVT